LRLLQANIGYSVYPLIYVLPNTLHDLRILLGQVSQKLALLIDDQLFESELSAFRTVGIQFGN
jgi:hypothetical protein